MKMNGKFSAAAVVPVLLLVNSIAAAQSLTAVITIDDRIWLDGSGDTIDMSSRFPGASLTRFHAPLPVFFQGWKSVPRESIADYEWDFGDGTASPTGNECLP
jgi:hypothetical protein